MSDLFDADSLSFAVAKVAIIAALLLAFGLPRLAKGLCDLVRRWTGDDR